MNLQALARPGSLAAVLAALALGLASCGDDEGTETAPSGDDSPGSSTSAPDEAGTGTTGTATGGGEATESGDVTIADFKFDPESVTVKVGGTVSWTNEDSAAHTATAKDGAPSSFDTGSLDQGDSKDVSFEKAGTYDYICSIHPTMSGSVEVTE